MFCNPKKVKQRIFQRCSLPSVRDLFARFGSRPSDGSFQSLDEPLPLHSSKIESLGYIQEFDDALNRDDARRLKQQQQQQQQQSE